MSRWRADRYSLGIGASDIGIVEAASCRLLTTLPLTEYLPGAANAVEADWAPVLEAVLAQAGGSAGGQVSITVSDAWTRYFMLNVPQGLGSLQELRLLAAARFEALFAVPPQGWRIEADWKSAGQLLVCALPERLLEVAAAISASGPWRIRSVKPWSVRLLESLAARIPDEAWVCCFDAGGMLALRIAAGGVAHVRRFARARIADAAALGELLEGESLRSGLALPPVLCLAGMLPEFEAGTLVAGMKLLDLSAGPAGRARPGHTAESVALALLGAQA